ncbi:MAG: hypothetical protein LIO93_05660 [Bacteroidales bacterium]|nr:hypothetical protein [Bacteroidales bacterium]
MNRIPKTAFFCLLFILSAFLYGMQGNHSSFQQEEPKKIYLLHADSSRYLKENNPDVLVPMGNVSFRHDSTYLYCDSAYIYINQNSLEAFSNVRIEQGDTLFIYGDYLIYDGNLNLAKMRENVRMENNEVTLFTDSFNYDRNINIGYYFDGGMLVDSLNELTSVYGQYSPETKIATFKEDVTLENPQFVLKSDTLMYSTENKIATILGPTEITSENGIIHSTKGWYATESEESTLYDQSTVISQDGTKTISADTLYYDRNTGIAEAFSNMVINDTVRKIILMGDYGYFDDLNDFAFATDSAQLIEYSQIDSLFLHADTLQMKTLGQEREVKAFYGVRFFRKDLQGVCDSLQYNTADSMLYLLRNPVLWNTGYQITGDTIKVLLNDSTINRFYVRERSFASEEVNETYFNQMKGKYMTGYFEGGDLSLVEIEGGTESIYYPIDEKNMEFVGRNKTESPYMNIYVANRKPVKIWWGPEPVAEMLPIPDLNPDQKFLKEFVDFNYLRPVDRYDIFRTIEMKEEDKPAPRRQRTRVQ